MCVGVCRRSRGCMGTRVRECARLTVRACVRCLQYTIILFDIG